MTVYAVILEDRHADVDVRLFSSKKKAVADFEFIVQLYLGWNGEVGEDSDICAGSWEHEATLSVEGDFVHIEELEIDAAVPA